MIFYYLDASAWVKRYYQEVGTTWVQDLFSRNCALACSSLGLIEVTATLSRKCKAREIGPTIFEEKVQELEVDWERFIHVHLTVEAVDIARVLARELALRGADAVHLASALLLQRRLAEDDDRLVFIASDHELNRAAQASDLIVVDPEKEEIRND